MRKLKKDDPLTLKASEMYSKGATLEEIAESLFISGEAVRKRFENAGIERRDRHNKRLDVRKVVEIQRDRASGMPLVEIARKHGVSVSAVHRYARNIPIKQTTKGGRV